MNEQQRLERLASMVPPDEACPDADTLAAYILEQLHGNEQLRVAAHVRKCPLCRYQASSCRPPQPRQGPLLARLVPMQIAGGQRSSLVESNTLHYIAAHLVIEMIIPQPTGEHWRITGQILSNRSGLENCVVTARSGRRRWQGITDTEGFFTFTGLPEGRYTISVSDSLVTVQIRDIILTFDEV
jgi:hypothetical protein